MAKRQAPSVEQIAAEVGRILGTTEVHAKRWLSQRKELVNALAVVRDRATNLITELGGEVTRRRGRKSKEGMPVVQPGMRSSRKKRVISAQARARMRAAAAARWAAIKGRKGAK